MDSRNNGHISTPQEDKKLTLVFIMGDGRSGSTISSIMLGNHPGIVSVGDLNMWPKYEGKPKYNNAKPEDHRFWEAVRTAYIEEAGPPDFEKLVNMQNEVEAYSNFFKLLLNRVSPEIYSEYRTHLNTLLKAISAVSDKEVILDLSKVPARAYMLLQHCPEVNTRVIHLVRDPRGVVWSQMKRNIEQKYKGPLQAMFHYSGKSFMASMVHLLNSKEGVLRVRYEDLMSQPRVELTRIGQFINLPMETLIEKVEAGAPLVVPSLLDGNRVRQNSTVTLRFDEEWKRKLASRHRVGTALVTLPFFVSYGYNDYFPFSKKQPA